MDTVESRRDNSVSGWGLDAISLAIWVNSRQLLGWKRKTPTPDTYAKFEDPSVRMPLRDFTYVKQIAIMRT
jgi:hypothetical protein